MGKIGKGLDASVLIAAGATQHHFLLRYHGALPELFNVSEVRFAFESWPNWKVLDVWARSARASTHQCL